MSVVYVRLKNLDYPMLGLPENPGGAETVLTYLTDTGDRRPLTLRRAILDSLLKHETQEDNEKFQEHMVRARYNLAKDIAKEMEPIIQLIWLNVIKIRMLQVYTVIIGAQGFEMLDKYSENITKEGDRGEAPQGS